MAEDGVISFHNVVVRDQYGAENAGQAKVINRTFWQALKRSGKRSGKIVGIILLCAPIALFVHVLLAASLLVLIAAGILFFIGLRELITFEYVEAECPSCKQKRQLTPFISPRYFKKVTVYCSQCGQSYQSEEGATT